MAVNYNDSRFQEVEKEKNAALNETKNQYDEIINKTDSIYQEQIDASKDWANKQSELQQANTDFAIEKVNQAKDKAQKDYTKEQKAAYSDYQKAVDSYGVNAEKMAAQGLQNSGYSESTRTNMYNTYQNRYSAARESYNQAILNYDNSIKEAQLANNSALATIAYEALQKQLELSLQGFQYKNQLILQKLEAVNQQEDRYYQRWQNVLSQINTENALAEQIRQFNKTYALSKAKASSSSSSSGSARLTDTSSGSSELSNSNSDSPTQLSQVGKEAYRTALAIYNSQRGGGKQAAANFLANTYNRGFSSSRSDVKGSLSESDLKIIANKLGLD